MDERYQDTAQFIIENENADTAKLLFSAKKFPNVNISYAVRAIEARRKIKNRVPSWYAVPDLIFPESLPLEQCSSEATASYKSQFVSMGASVADMTGGLGVDTSFFARRAGSVDYFERNPQLIECAEHNFKRLELDRTVSIHHSELSVSILQQLAMSFDLVFLDPARRGKGGSKVFTLGDCEPNLLELKDAIFGCTDNVLVKLSPMADISVLKEEVNEIKRIDIVSVDNECKELLLHLEKGCDILLGDIPIYAVNLPGKFGDAALDVGGFSEFCFTINGEKEAAAEMFSSALGDVDGRELFLYEPNKSILKGGAFKSVAVRFGLKKVDVNTHLYVSERFVGNFPGKVFKVMRLMDFNKSAIKELRAVVTGASVTARNLPIDSNALRVKLSLKEDDSVHIFACTAFGGYKKLFLTSRL